MYSRYGLGLNSLNYGTVGVKEAIFNAKKTSQIVKSEMQLTKMTNLLKSINSENEILTEKLVKLSDENKQLKRVVADTERNKTLNNSREHRQTEFKDYSSISFAKKQKQMQTVKPVQMNYSIMNTINHHRKDAHLSEFKPSSFLRDYKSTQTSPPKSIVPSRTLTHEIAVSTNRTPQKHQQKKTKTYENPQVNFNRSVMKSRTHSLHRLTPSDSIQIKGMPLTSFRSTNPNQETPIRGLSKLRDTDEGTGKKRYLSLVSLRKQK